MNKFLEENYIKLTFSQLGSEFIPSLLYIYFNNENDDLKKFSLNSLFHFLEESKENDANSGNISCENLNNSEEPEKIIDINSQNTKFLTLQVIEQVFHFFAISVDSLSEEKQIGALSPLMDLFESTEQIITKKIILDTVNFLLLFINNPNMEEKIFKFIEKISDLSQKHCDIESIIAIQSILKLFSK